MKQRKTIDELQVRYGKRRVVLVDENDNEIGGAGLIEAHRDPGFKHRAFSLQLFRKNNGKIELLLQQRAEEKPVFPYYWANTCCYNMAPGEEYIPRAVSRVKEEIGAEIEEKILRELYKFSYYAPDIEGWCENELDNVIVGEWSGELALNPEEAMDTRWIEWGELKKDVENYPQKYAPWFKTILSNERFERALDE